MSTNENSSDSNEVLKQRLNDLTLRVHSEVSKARESHEAALLSLSMDCSKALHDLTVLFENRLQSMQHRHREYILQIEEEISYLKEITDSQHIMLQNNIEYIKELEDKYVKKPD